MRSTFFEGAESRAIRSSSSSRTLGPHIVVKPISTSQWKVGDNRWSEREAQHLLGFIEITESLEFEVMALTHGFEWFIYPTLAEACAHFAYVTATDAPLDREPHDIFNAVAARPMK